MWRTDLEDPVADVDFDVNEKIQFRIEEEIFTNIKPTGPALDDEEEEEEEQQQVAAASKGDKTLEVEVKPPKKDLTPPPYALIASCQTEGMGAISWWG
mgnify:CR=1 FL=1